MVLWKIAIRIGCFDQSQGNHWLECLRSSGSGGGGAAALRRCGGRMARFEGTRHLVLDFGGEALDMSCMCANRCKSAQMRVVPSVLLLW